MKFPSFQEWLENRIRTGLGIYPPLYAVGQYPPLYSIPYSATAALAVTTIHKKVHPKLLKKKITKKSHKKKQKKKNSSK